VADCGDGVIENHPRAGKAHHGADLFTHARFVAVHAAVDAEGLRLHERAVLGAGAGVVVQRRALGTEHALCVVIAAAVEGDHLRDHLLFALALGFDTLHQLILPCSTE